jgi:hypothetical protein
MVPIFVMLCRRAVPKVWHASLFLGLRHVAVFLLISPFMLGCFHCFFLVRKWFWNRHKWSCITRPSLMWRFLKLFRAIVKRRLRSPFLELYRLWMLTRASAITVEIYHCSDDILSRSMKLASWVEKVCDCQNPKHQVVADCDWFHGCTDNISALPVLQATIWGNAASSHEHFFGFYSHFRVWRKLPSSRETC